jgi:hypothetical protein
VSCPKVRPEKTELRYHTSSQLGQLLRELREDKASYFGHLTPMRLVNEQIDATALLNHSFIPNALCAPQPSV